MKIHVINLDRAASRLSHMEAELGRLGLAFERVAGVEGASLSRTDIAELAAAPDHAPMSASEIGCFLGHRACFERIAARDQPFGVVMEDDLNIAADAGALLASSTWIPRDADIVKLETNGQPTLLAASPVAGAHGRELRRLRGKHLGGAAYVVSRDCAARLVGLTARPAEPIDELLFNPAHGLFRTLTIYQMTPAPCVQESVREGFAAGRRLPSQLEAARLEGRTRRRGLAKLGRELQRPVERLIPILRGTVGSVLTGEVRVRVPFA